MRLALLVPVLLLGACSVAAPPRVGKVPGQTPDSLRNRGVRVEDRGRRNVSWTDKVVTSKMPPSTLVARDHTECEVAKDEFAKVEIGQRYGCTWVTPSVSSVATSP